ncbi:MAG: hypothetical protein DMG86_05410 [Acidobacteria bacterium]|nr:MAG: hypothetical protein DMG86_05410 [Acidobacteriota bacterium]PYX16745.1 MAG: hypothetical protein DMG84_06000 [Acidobacteriota bacterium]
MPLVIRCFGKGEEAEALIRQRDGPGIVEDEVKAYLLCIDSEEFFDRNGESGGASTYCGEVCYPS